MEGKEVLFAAQDALIAEYKAQGRREEIQAALKEVKKQFVAKGVDIPKDLCYLTGKYRDDYLHDMKICQEYAVENRAAIARIVLGALDIGVEDRFETIHNYIDMDSNIVRKGAICAKKGEKVLIPINMRDGCILGVGKGNDDWNQSAPHGAGRLMSRTKAKEALSMEEYRNSMSGIYTTSVNADTLDEAPMAYKPIQEIVDCIADTVDVVGILKPIYNFKASE
jgi:RNA-splicing ligase RtcB